MKKKVSKNKQEPYEPITKRLDALIRVILETLYDKKDKKFNEATAARMLKSAGLTPTDVAKILGKKDATAVAPYLYPKGKKNKRTKKLAGEPNDKQESNESPSQ